MIRKFLGKVVPYSVHNSMKRRYYGLGDVNSDYLELLERSGIKFGTHEFKRFYKSGLISDVDEGLVADTKRYHLSKIGKSFDPIISIACQHLYGMRDPRFLPRSFYWEFLIPSLNDMSFLHAYSDKNLFSRILPDVRQPDVLLKRVNDEYFDENDRDLERKHIPDFIRSRPASYIVKPSRSGDGDNIQSLTSQEDGIFLSGKSVSWGDVEKSYGDNFLVQHLVRQHPVLAKPHPYSVNTLRLLTLRWGRDVVCLQAFFRVGCNGAVNDNAGTGGVCVGVEEDGLLRDLAFDSQSFRFRAHPSTGYDFQDRVHIPGFGEAVEMCKLAHLDIMHHKLISWDIAIDEASKPICIEFNLKGSLWLYQLCTGKPLLGDMTDEVLSSIRRKLGWL